MVGPNVYAAVRRCFMYAKKALRTKRRRPRRSKLTPTKISRSLAYSLSPQTSYSPAAPSTVRRTYLWASGASCLSARGNRELQFCLLFFHWKAMVRKKYIFLFFHSVRFWGAAKDYLMGYRPEAFITHAQSRQWMHGRGVPWGRIITIYPTLQNAKRWRSSKFPGIKIPRGRRRYVHLTGKWISWRRFVTQTWCRLYGAATHYRPLHVVTEFCSGGCLFELLHNCDHIDLNWEQKYKILLDVASAMEYLHDNGVIHRDLKSLNMLLQSPLSRDGDIPVCKVTDFGLSRMKDSTDEWGSMTSAVGDMPLDGSWGNYFIEISSFSIYFFVDFWFFVWGAHYDKLYQQGRCVLLWYDHVRGNLQREFRTFFKKTSRFLTAARVGCVPIRRNRARPRCCVPSPIRI